MADKKSQNLSRPATEEIEWTAEDDAIMDRVMEKARREGWKADPVQPTTKKTTTQQKKGGQ